MCDSLGEECGLFGVYGAADAVESLYLGLISLQHRGEESAGIVCTDGRDLLPHVGMGLVSEVFNAPDVEGLRTCSIGIGHVRYSTLGTSHIKNAQPLLYTIRGRPLAVALNGQIVNAGVLKREYENRGGIFTTSTDTEVIPHLLADPDHANLGDPIEHALGHLEGAFSILILTPEQMVAARDPHGFRPLCIGRKENAFAVASESCAFDHTGFKLDREIRPGEMVVINRFGMQSRRFAPKETPRAQCVFELIYFSRDDSLVFDQSVYAFRKRLGSSLAVEAPVEADVVMSVPTGGDAATIGYHERSGIPIEHGFVRNRYVGRTFIRPADIQRWRLADIKLNPIAAAIRGKRVVVVDDSIVRGTTSRSRFGLIRQAGAKEIHFRITCPPLKHPCFYGVDVQKDEELIASRYEVNQIRDFLGVDSLHYLSLDSLLAAAEGHQDDFCVACFTGRYPIRPPEDIDKSLLERPWNGRE